MSELLTLVDPTSSAPAIDETAFPSTPSAWTWSSSAHVGANGGSWGVDFDDGSSFTNSGSYAAHVRRVSSEPVEMAPVLIAKSVTRWPIGCNVGGAPGVRRT